MFINLKRILKFGWQGFWRNKSNMAQVVCIMAVIVFLATSFFLARELILFLITQVENKVDVAVYFKNEATEESILAVKEELSKLSLQVKAVDYVSRAESLENFKQRHKEEPVYLDALEEIEDNPFLASLNIKAYDPQSYAYIASSLEEGVFRNLIEKISYTSYSQNRRVIEKLSTITSKIKTGGITVSLFLGVLALLITFNAIKLTILTTKEEITTMRLVGAANWFIRTPFVIQSILYGVFAVLIVDLFLCSGVLLLNTKIQPWILDFNLASCFFANFPMIFLAQIASVAVLGVISSCLAIRKYLKI